jgi:hypothetical protein
VQLLDADVCRRDVEQPLHRGRLEAVGDTHQLLHGQERDVLDESHAEARLQRAQQAVVLAHRQSELGADVRVHFKCVCVFYTRATSLYKCLLRQITLAGVNFSKYIHHKHNQ